MVTLSFSNSFRHGFVVTEWMIAEGWMIVGWTIAEGWMILEEWTMYNS